MDERNFARGIVKRYGKSRFEEIEGALLSMRVYAQHLAKAKCDLRIAAVLVALKENPDFYTNVLSRRIRCQYCRDCSCERCRSFLGFFKSLGFAGAQATEMVKMSLDVQSRIGEIARVECRGRFAAIAAMLRWKQIRNEQLTLAI